jgi:hypothetical protein
MSNDQRLHPVAEQAVEWIVTNRRPLTESEANQLASAIVALPDEVLGDALVDLHRVAGYFHQVLEAPAVAAQLLLLCHEVTPQLVAATERLLERRRETERKNAAAYRRMAGLSSDRDGKLDAPAVGTKPQLSVNDLRPPRQFN